MVVSFGELVGQRVYLDANILIHALEGHPLHNNLLRTLMGRLKNKEIIGVTSEISLAETLVKPMKDKNQSLIAYYEFLIGKRSFLQVIPVDRDILFRSAQLRSVSRLKLPDSVHVATAEWAGCEVFLSEDTMMDVPPPMVRREIGELSEG